LLFAAFGLMTTTALLAVNGNTTDHHQDTPTQTSPSESKLRPVVTLKPKYPRSAFTDKIEGYVTMEFEVTTNGAVENVRVVDSEPGTVFDAEAVRAMEKFRFVPIERTFTARKTIEFKLSE